MEFKLPKYYAELRRKARLQAQAQADSPHPLPLDYRHKLEITQVTSTILKRTKNQRFKVQTQFNQFQDPGTRIKIAIKIFFIFFI